MSKLNLVNLVQCELAKDEARKTKGGDAACGCCCPGGDRVGCTAKCMVYKPAV